jgi:hypothetical protein
MRGLIEAQISRRLFGRIKWQTAWFKGAIADDLKAGRAGRG